MPKCQSLSIIGTLMSEWVFCYLGFFLLAPSAPEAAMVSSVSKRASILGERSWNSGFFFSSSINLKLGTQIGTNCDV